MKRPVSMAPVIFPPSMMLQAHDQSATRRNQSGSVFGYRPGRCGDCSFSPPKPATFWQNGDDSLFRREKAKFVRGFSAIISQVQSSSPWAGNYTWSEKERWPAVKKDQRGAVSKANNGSKVRGGGHLPAGCVHTAVSLGRLNLLVTPHNIPALHVFFVALNHTAVSQ